MSLNATNLYIQASPIPATFKGTPNDLYSEMIKRMRIVSPSGTNFIFIGDTEPTSNVGPWLKNGTQWYVWDNSINKYVPQDISASFTPAFWLGNSVPSSTDPTVWLQTTLNPTNTNPLAYGSAIRWFAWDGSRWAWPNPISPASNERRLWTGSLADLYYHDGGDGTDPAGATDYTGAMWAQDTTITPVPTGATMWIKRSVRKYYTP